jgi:hypothetical protein
VQQYRRCNAIVYREPSGLGGKRPSNPCKKRVLKRGLCVEHDKERVDAAEKRRLTVTRHKIGHAPETNRTLYGTIEDTVETNWCHLTRCRKAAQINVDGVLWCMDHFQREQRRRTKDV